MAVPRPAPAAGSGYPAPRWRACRASMKRRRGRAYLRHEAGDSYNGERVDAFLAHGPEAVDFFTANTEVQFDMPLVFPDYHAEAAGGKQGGRSMVARLRRPQAGRARQDLAPALPELTVFGMMLGSGKEIVHFMRATRSLASAWYVAKRLSRHFLDVLKHGRGHDADQRQCAGGPAGGQRLQAGHTAVAECAGQVADHRGRRGERRGGAARWRIGARARAPWCWRRAAFPISSGASSTPTRPPASSIIRRRPRAIPATACAWPRARAAA